MSLESVLTEFEQIEGIEVATIVSKPPKSKGTRLHLTLGSEYEGYGDEVLSRALANINRDILPQKYDDSDDRITVSYDAITIDI